MEENLMRTYCAISILWLFFRSVFIAETLKPADATLQQTREKTSVWWAGIDEEFGFWISGYDSNPT